MINTCNMKRNRYIHSGLVDLRQVLAINVNAKLLTKIFKPLAILPVGVIKIVAGELNRDMVTIPPLDQGGINLKHG